MAHENEISEKIDSYKYIGQFESECEIYEPTYSMEILSKEKSKDFSVSLENLINVLQRYFDNLDPSKCKDILIVLGNTGSGKSTLLGSMIVGPENLEMKVVE